MAYQYNVIHGQFNREVYCNAVDGVIRWAHNDEQVSENVYRAFNQVPASHNFAEIVVELEIEVESEDATWETPQWNSDNRIPSLVYVLDEENERIDIDTELQKAIMVELTDEIEAEELETLFDNAF